jgi:hypothetical protein
LRAVYAMQEIKIFTGLTQNCPSKAHRSRQHKSVYGKESATVGAMV